ncbi:MAG: hypothetical protein ABEJ56_04445 [Candidatus Nanohaloarchaea archaeon]
MVQELAVEKKFYKNSDSIEREKTEKTFYIGEDQLEKLQETGNASKKLREIIDNYYKEDGVE